MYFKDGLGLFLVIFDHFFFFLPGCFGPIWAKNTFFWLFLKNMIFSQKSDDLNRFLEKFPFRKCILLYTLLH